MAPKPIQRPHPPIIYPGQSAATLERVAEQGQGSDSIGVEPKRLAGQIEKLQKALERHGRSRDDITIHACPYPNECDRDTIRRYNEIGIDQTILLHPATSSSVDELESLLRQLADEYIEFVASL